MYICVYTIMVVHVSVCVLENEEGNLHRSSHTCDAQHHTSAIFHVFRAVFLSLNVHVQLEEEAAHLEARALQLRGTIHSLWERLEVPQEERDSFTQLHVGHKPKTIAAVSFNCPINTCHTPASVRVT